MPTSIAVWRDFSVQPLLEITDPEFAHWYGLGVFWALYGDEQGLGSPSRPASPSASQPMSHRPLM